MSRSKSSGRPPGTGAQGSTRRQGGEVNEPLSFGRRISELAAQNPHKTAMVFISPKGDERRTSWSELDARSNRFARLLSERGVSEHSLVIVGLSNCPEHILVTVGGWKLGACVLPLNASTPARERDQILDIANPKVIVADWEGIPGKVIRPSDFEQVENLSDEPLPDRVPHPGKAMASGGSTGRPKVIVNPKPWAGVPGNFVAAYGPLTGFNSRQVQLVPGPLYHNSPFCWSHYGLFEDHTLVVMERFNAAQAVDAIERHRVSFAQVVPTMMRRIVQLPDIQKRDLSSLEAVFHTAAPCPPWVKEAWIDLVGGEKIYEAYGSTEEVGFTAIRGDEWLEHRGSVGLPHETELRILDADGNSLPPGEVGEIFMKSRNPDGPSYEYLGSPPAKSTEDGFVSVGDLGWVDDEGYLFIADRRVDMIVTGGVNVYPAELEAVLTEHQAVGDVAVIGVPDEEWGRRVHAIIESATGVATPSVEELYAHCRGRLTPHKVPKSYEFVETLPRDEAGKIRRGALAAERELGSKPQRSS